MAEHSGIEWTDATWNPWYGCEEVSPGCDHCYARREMERYGREWKVTRSKTKFDDPLKWSHEPRAVFTCSWSDWFQKDADPWRNAAWSIVEQTPWNTYLILTKRTGRIERHLPWSAFGDPWPNVWLGTSIENQDAIYRARQLKTIAAAVRFLSLEPLLGPVALDLAGIHWAIVGGESGPGARPMDPNWARSLRDACLGAHVKFFLKQLGGYPDPRAHAKAVLDGRRWTERPDLQVVGGTP